MKNIKRCRLCDKRHYLFDDYCEKCRDDINLAKRRAMKARVMPEGQNVYAISVAGDRAALVKFGFSSSPSSRLNTLQTGSPVKLEIIAACRGLRHHEKMIHGRLRRDRVYGEWFQRSANVEEVIRHITAGSIVEFLEDRGARLRTIKHLQEQSAVV